MQTNRIAYLDVVRVLACLMVIFMHAPIPGNGAPGYALTGLSFITTPCIGLFFMVSGALILPVKISMQEFYKKRLTKVVIPTVIWSLIYLGAKLIEGTITCQQLPSVLLSIPFSAQGHGVMWFMYTLIGLYLLSPLISPWLASATKRDVEIVLCLWLVSLVFPMLAKVITVNDGNTGLLYYFSGFAGYYLLGFYLERFNPKIGVGLSIALIVIPIIVCGFSIYLLPELDFYQFFWYLSIWVVSMSVGWFSLIKNTPVHQSNMLISISSLSFGIYLCHILVMRYFLWHVPFINGINWMIQIIVTAVLTFVISLLLSWLISVSPIGKYGVGVKTRSTR